MKMFLLPILFVFPFASFAQEVPSPPVEAATTTTTLELVKPTETKEEIHPEFPEFEFKSYGYIVFGQRETFKSVQNLEPFVRREMDLAEIAFEGEYEISPTAEIEFEIEIEHGGVGSAIEFDPFEEFGEFESEIEKGGEVVLHELYYTKFFNKYKSALKIGKFPVFISLGSVITKPSRYASILVSDVEARMIPLGWTEMGVQFEHQMGPVKARLGLANGLNSEFFRSYSWVGGGYQRHFETTNGDDLAAIASLELGDVSKGRGFAISRYYGDTTGNRYKIDKLTEPATVMLLSFMGAYKYKNVGFMGQLIQGELENSDLVSQKNATLGGLAKPKAFSPLGHIAVLQTAQISYDVAEDFTFFVKAEHVDTFAEIQGNIAKNPRYDVNKRGGGFVWFFDTAAFLKAQYLREKTNLVGLPETYQMNFAFGFDLDRF